MDLKKSIAALAMAASVASVGAQELTGSSINISNTQSTGASSSFSFGTEFNSAFYNKKGTMTGRMFHSGTSLQLFSTGALIEGFDASKTSSNKIFSISKNGTEFANSLNVYEGSFALWASDINSSGRHYGTHLSLSYNKNYDRFEMSTSSYCSSADCHNVRDVYFDLKTAIFNCPIVCKDGLDVSEINAGEINTKDIRVKMNNVADYVFDENYNLMPLSEVEAYVNENKHLPGIPAAAEMESNGMSVSKMNNLLLEKVEELTLHMIALEKENAALKARVSAMEK